MHADLRIGLRILAAAGLAWFLGPALAAPEIPLATRALAVLVFAATLWQPAVALAGAAALMPAGALLGAPPARVAELIAWAFLAGWLLALRRPLAEAGWPRVIRPALLYAGCALASWLALGIGGAAGVSLTALPVFLVNLLPSHYLVFSVPHTGTWTMVQLATGVAIFVAASAIARTESRAASWLATAVVVSAAALGVATVASVAWQWAASDYGPWFLARYLAGERFSAHLADVNAAGSHYVLAGGIAAALVLRDAGRRWFWIATIAAMLPAFWLTGSRSAFVGAAAAAAVAALAINAARVRISPRQSAVAGGLVVILLVGGAIAAAQAGGEPGSAAEAMRLRAQFSETSARMFASAPIFGVGVGNYFERSPEFMPGELRALYGAENAHNYFAQTFAELGIVGGVLFLWLLAATPAAAWRTLATGERGTAYIGLFAGAAGYLVTCLTGHPFLVAETALPFWVAFGALGAAATSRPATTARRALVAVVAGVLCINVGAGAVAYATMIRIPPERGFDIVDETADGTEFRWISPHVVTYAPGGPGVLRLTLRPPDRPLSRPMVVETAIAGRVMDRRELAASTWTTIEIPVRDHSAALFRRIDVRVTPSWTARRHLAQRSSDVNVSLTAMVSELEWDRAGR